MKFNKKLFLVLIPLLLLLFILSSCGIIPQSPEGKISGRVLIPSSEMSKDIAGWVPVANAVVTMVDADGITHTVTTDENGYYAFENIAVNPNTIITATITVNGETIILKDVITQAVTAEENYDAGDMDPESTTLALILEALTASGIDPSDIDLQEIKSGDGFFTLVNQLTSVLEEEGDVTAYIDAVFFAVDGATTTNPANSSMVTIVFPDTVTYNGNNNTGGTIPVYSKYYVEGTTVIVIGNTGSLEKTGYTFDGWNTAADGTGIDYAPGETFVMGASDVTLYAKWTIIPTYILTLNADTGGSVNDVSGEYYEGTIVGINAIPDTGYQFVDWTINSGDAGCVADTSSKSTTVAMNEDMTLTANFCEPEDFFDFDKITGTITGYNTAGGLDVVIPRMIDGVLVEHIGDWAFNNKNLISVTIPDSVTIIGDYAFSYNNLISVTIPDSVTIIGDYAFIQNGLRYLILGNSLTSIGCKTFSYNRLYEVTIPDSVTTISDWAFYHTELYKVTIPDNVTIGPYAFTDNDLTWITIGADVSINYYDYTMGDNKGFKDFYNDGGRIAGTYFFSGSWILWI